MAISKEQSLDILDRVKSFCQEHGEVHYFVCIKDEDDFWRYCINCSALDAVTLVRALANETISTFDGGEDETGEDFSASPSQE